MPSGKQLSFAYGEIAPSLHYSADSDFFRLGLKKLLNGIVRGEGGISNRSGAQYMPESANVSQDDSTGLGTGARIFNFTGPDKKEYMVVVTKTIPEFTNVAIPPALFPDPPVFPIQVFEVGNPTPKTVETAFSWMAAQPEAIIDLDTLEFNQIKDDLIITFEVAGVGSPWIATNGLLNIFKDPAGTDKFFIGNSPRASFPTGIPSSNFLGAITYYWLSTGLQPQPVVYEVWQELFDGSEFKWQAGYYKEGMPNQSTTNQVAGYDLDDSAEVKQYNVYRAAGAIVGSSAVPTGAFGLVSRLPADSALTLNGDALITPDMTVTPPIDDSIHKVVTPYGNIKKLFFAKERYLAVPIDDESDDDVFCSKLGAKFFWMRGLAPNELDAFSFAVRGNGGRSRKGVKAFADVGTTLCFTDDTAFALKGREGGIISYASINPSPVTNEGIADNTPPVGIDNFIYYLNDDRTSVIAINESLANPGAFEVRNISTLSNHLLKRRDMIRMAVVKSNETILWMVNRKGKLVSVTLNSSSGVTGFAQHELGGFVEDISVSKASSDDSNSYNEAETFTDTLTVSIIRDGVRSIERLYPRDDEAVNNFLYADASEFFGGEYNPAGYTLELQAADFAAGNPITIQDTANPTAFQTSFPLVIDVEKSDGSFLRLYDITKVDDDTLTGFCDQDIPADRQASTLARFIFPTRYISGVTRLANKQIVAFADGSVLSSPLNGTFERTPITVTNLGLIDLGDYYHFGYYGLPYKFTAQTLPLESSDNRTFTDKGKLINRVGVAVVNTLSGLITQQPDVELNNDTAGFVKLIRDSNLVDNEELFTGVVDESFPSEWDSKGSVCIHQVDPLPITVTAIYPKGVIGG